MEYLTDYLKSLDESKALRKLCVFGREKWTGPALAEFIKAINKVDSLEVKLFFGDMNPCGVCENRLGVVHPWRNFNGFIEHFPFQLGEQPKGVDEIQGNTEQLL